MSCIGCEYDSFVMWGNKKVPYCKYFRQIKLSDENLCGREKQHGWDNFCGYCGADMRGDKE